MSKRWNLLFTFPKLPAGHAQQFKSVEATDVGVAINRGLKEIKKNPAIKGKRITEGRVNFTLEDGKED